MHRRTWILMICAAAVCATQVMASTSAPARKSTKPAKTASAEQAEPGLDGNCPVCLVKMDKLVEGETKLSSVYDATTYLFPGAKQKEMFDADPAAFVPALGGDCVVCKVEMGKDVPGDPKFRTVHDGRLFLFPSEKQQKMFAANPGKYADADLALDGNCAVCLVKADKQVPGDAKFASIHDGKRYLFPGEDQKKMFDANPAAFVPAMGGNCAVCKVEMGKDVAGKDEFYTTHNGRLYLFPSAKQQKMFTDNPAKYANADVALGGNCVVCKVEMNKDVQGTDEHAVDYDGTRYLFPSEKQLGMFLANPQRYVPQG